MKRRMMLTSCLVAILLIVAAGMPLRSRTSIGV